jgi:anti-sigma regulatory factor (Ser/Thr protein kinase)
VKIRITVPSNPKCLILLRNLVKGALPAEKFEDTVIENIVLAVDEACSNVIEHSYHTDITRELSMTMKSDTEKVSFLIEDTGVGCAPMRLKKPDLKEFVKERRDGGLGRYIISNVMHEIKYSRRGKKNRLTLVRYYNGEARRKRND